MRIHGVAALRGFGLTVRRGLTVAAIVAQVGAVIAPLVDARDACDPGPMYVAGMTVPGANRLGPQQDRGPAHDPTTCPACIVQSLHASPASGSRAPAFVLAERTSSDRVLAVRPHLDRPTSRHSRAPPTLG